MSLSSVYSAAALRYAAALSHVAALTCAGALSLAAVPSPGDGPTPRPSPPESGAHVYVRALRRFSATTPPRTGRIRYASLPGPTRPA